MSEQEIISKYFSHHQPDNNIELGIGDDAAVVIPPNDSKLVLTTDTLNEGVHFFPDCLPEDVGYKVLAVNLSDLAAMGAAPLWGTINLSIPKVKDTWLSAFSGGLFALADQYNIKIVGGDLVKGPLSISMHVIGYLATDKVLTRSGAQAGDLIFVSGTLGDAALGHKLQGHTEALNLDLKDQEYVRNRFNRPEPRIELGLEIVNFASTAIDISDGLLKDLQHITSMSQVGADIHLEKLPISSALQAYITELQDWTLPLTGGEDYEIIFTANEKYREKINQIIDNTHYQITNIGKITSGKDINTYQRNTQIKLPQELGFDHFK